MAILAGVGTFWVVGLASILITVIGFVFWPLLAGIAMGTAIFTAVPKEEKKEEPHPLDKFLP